MLKIGKKIKNLRLLNGLTQQELADRTDLSKGFISQVESEQVSLSLSTLESILVCLGTNFSEFFSDEQKDKIVYTTNDIVSKEFDENGYNISWLISDSQKHRMEPIIVNIEPGGETIEDDPHDGEEFGHVISGTIELILQKKHYKVKKGESFYFKPQLPHRIKNISKSNAKILWVSTPPNF